MAKKFLADAGATLPWRVALGEARL